MHLTLARAAIVRPFYCTDVLAFLVILPDDTPFESVCRDAVHLCKDLFEQRPSKLETFDICPSEAQTFVDYCHLRYGLQQVGGRTQLPGRRFAELMNLRNHVFFDDEGVLNSIGLNYF